MRWLVGLVGVGTLVGLVGCSAEPEKKTTAAPAATATQTATVTRAAVPAGWHTVKAPQLGISLDVPKRWVDVDVNAKDVSKKLENSGFRAANSEFFKRGLKAMKGMKLLYIVDTGQNGKGYVNNISGACAPNQGQPVDQLKNKVETGMTSMGVTDLKVTDLTIGGHRAVRATYMIQAKAEAVQFRMVLPGDLMCGITFGAAPGTMPPEVDQIAATIRPL